MRKTNVFLVVGVPIYAIFKPDDEVNFILARAGEVGLWLYCAPSVKESFTHVGLKLMSVETVKDSFTIATNGALKDTMKQVRKKVAALGVENVKPELILGVHWTETFTP